jgi:ABC-type Zn uptake system ZnuABC Zn-binding protein ZnuA
MNRRLHALLLFVLIASLAACGPGAGPTAAPAQSTAAATPASAVPATATQGSPAPTGSATAPTPGAPTSTPRAKLNVVSSVAPLVNIIFNVAGDKVQVVGIIPEGTDSHTFEPAPSDAVKLSKADVMFFNGLDLEAPTIKLAQANQKAGAQIVILGELTVKPDQYQYDFSFPKELGHPNPHLWMNPMNALRYGEIVKDTLSARDSANAIFYQANYDKLKQRISDLDAAIAKSLDSIPPNNRKLLTYHDSFAYFVVRYPVMKVIGAIQPSSFAEPSAQEVAKLILQIKAEKVPAIFGSEVFPSKVLEQIAKESGAKFVDKLRDDELPGKRGDKVHSYVGLMVEDVSVLTTALGGAPKPMESIDTTNIPGGEAAVEQAR